MDCDSGTPIGGKISYIIFAMLPPSFLATRPVISCARVALEPRWPLIRARAAAIRIFEYHFDRVDRGVFRSGSL